MSATLTVHEAGPALTVQDLGRPGLTGRGLSVGGAADRRALWQAAALLGLARPPAALEMAGMGGRFSADAPLRFALTGAPMRAEIGGRPLRWNAVHRLAPGEVLKIGPATAGVYGYLVPAGGLALAPFMGSVSAHLAAGIGAPLGPGDTLPLGPDPAPGTPALALPEAAPAREVVLRLMPGPQSDLYDEATRARFFATAFRRGAQANRQGVELVHDGAPFAVAGGRRLASDFIAPGDVQMTGEGAPYVLACECQTMGGYPRIGTVIAADLPPLVQAPLGATIRFAPLTLAEADALWQDEAQWLAEARGAAFALVRDPHDIPDLMSYDLISGVTAGDELDHDPKEDPR